MKFAHRRPAVLRFWDKVAVRRCGCWEWTANRCAGGYGRFGAGPRLVQAHRFAYELMVGPIPEGLTIDHLCRNRACVNPSHLEAVTFRENVLRGTGASAVHAAKTHCHKGHPFSGPNLHMYREPKTGVLTRRCRECQRLRSIERRRSAVAA